MREIDLAYIAGLFDGEGSVNIYSYRSSKNGRQYRRPILRITNTHKETLEFVKKFFDSGFIHKKKDKRDTRKSCFNYQVGNSRALEILKELRPFLKVKAAWADYIFSVPSGGAVDENFLVKAPF